MSTTQLTVSDPGLIAEFFSPEVFRAFFEKRLEVPPDHMGLLMRNGQYVQAYTGAHFSVGGIFNQIKGIVGGSQSVSLLLADLKPFQIAIDFRSITKDKVEVSGCASIDLQINPERPQNVIGLMSGRKALSRDDIARRIRATLTDRVFEASVGRMNADEVRGNRGLQDLIQADTMKEIERVLGDLGVLIRHSSVEWAVNDVERSQMARAAAERAAQDAEFQFAQLTREMERQNETTEFRIASETSAERLRLESEADLQRLVMDQEIRFVDARETAKRIQELKVLEHEIGLLRTERLHKFETDIANATHLGVDMKTIDERRRRIERETEMLDTRHRLDLRRLEDEYGDERRRRERELKEKDQESDFDRREREARVAAAERAALLQSQIAADKAAIEKLEGLNDLQSNQDRQRLEERLRESESRHKQQMDLARLEAEREETRMERAARLTPEQMLALNAGLSPQVAKVLEEQARSAAAAAGNAQAMDLMKQMVAMADRNATQTADQAKALAQMIVQGAVGVATGVGGGRVADASGGLAAEPTTIDCPKCGRTNEVKNRFCVGCGAQLRT